MQKVDRGGGASPHAGAARSAARHYGICRPSPSWRATSVHVSPTCATLLVRARRVRAPRCARSSTKHGSTLRSCTRQSSSQHSGLPSPHAMCPSRAHQGRRRLRRLACVKPSPSHSPSKPKVVRLSRRDSRGFEVASTYGYGFGTDYSKGLSDRNRLAGGSQLISKFLREIEPTVRQFLNVHAFRK